VIDVFATIDTDGAALPPARCDISTFADISIFVCPSIALSSSANRSPIEAPPSLVRGDFATFIRKFFLHFFHSFSSHPFLSFRPLSPFTRPLLAASAPVNDSPVFNSSLSQDPEYHPTGRSDRYARPRRIEDRRTSDFRD